MKPFADLVRWAMGERGISLRALCREARIDPSFFSKVLSGKRSPPSEEHALRKIAEVLGLDPVSVVVSAGKIPAEWGRLTQDSDLLMRVENLVRGNEDAASSVPTPRASVSRISRSAAAGAESTAIGRIAPAPVFEPVFLSEELL